VEKGSERQHLAPRYADWIGMAFLNLIGRWYFFFVTVTYSHFGLGLTAEYVYVCGDVKGWRLSGLIAAHGVSYGSQITGTAHGLNQSINPKGALKACVVLARVSRQWPNNEGTASYYAVMVMASGMHSLGQCQCQSVVRMRISINQSNPQNSRRAQEKPHPGATIHHTGHGRQTPRREASQAWKKLRAESREALACVTRSIYVYLHAFYGSAQKTTQENHPSVRCIIFIRKKKERESWRTAAAAREPERRPNHIPSETHSQKPKNQFCL